MGIKKGDKIFTRAVRGDVGDFNSISIEVEYIEVEYIVLKVISEDVYLCRAMSNDIYEQVDGCKDRIIHYNQVIKIVKDKDNEK